MEFNEIKSKIMNFLDDQFMTKFCDGQTDEEIDLLENGLVDSYGYIELLTFMEAEFGIKLADDEVVSPEMASLKGMVTLVSGKCNGAGSK